VTALAANARFTWQIGVETSLPAERHSRRDRRWVASHRRRASLCRTDQPPEDRAAQRSSRLLRATTRNRRQNASAHLGADHAGSRDRAGALGGAIFERCFANSEQYGQDAEDDDRPTADEPEDSSLRQCFIRPPARGAHESLTITRLHHRLSSPFPPSQSKLDAGISRGSHYG
jgi:hypothetical protein